MVRRVARGATDVVLGVLGIDGVHMLRTTDVAGEAASVDILG
jgi:DNA helicase TIP49 (TBP-interacting protein)